MGYDMQSILTDIMIYPGYTQIFWRKQLCSCYLASCRSNVIVYVICARTRDYACHVDMNTCRDSRHKAITGFAKLLSPQGKRGMCCYCLEPWLKWRQTNFLGRIPNVGSILTTIITSMAPSESCNMYQKFDPNWQHFSI